ncbi:MAG: DUF2934 domain-containing protein [Betaproteobacteria bacterium]
MPRIVDAAHRDWMETIMTTAQMHRSRKIGRNPPQAAKRKTKPKRVIGTIHQKTADPRNEFSDEEWQDMVATAAYYRAQARGFDEGSPEDDWYEAEAELRAQLAGSQAGTESVSDSGAGAPDIEREGE